MLKCFIAFIEKEDLFKHGDRILLAVSGGADSVAMTELFHKAGYNFAIAHCNFHLRGDESDKDEQFVKDLAAKYNVKFYSKQFDTKAFADQKGISVEMAARELRYNWFSELLHIKHSEFNIQNSAFSYVATAHHLDDEAETFFINLLRGTGISGLHGILPKQNKIIRPMLFADRADILNFLKNNNITYREDSSNSTLQFVRNKIRHQVIPVFKEINPSFVNNLGQTIQHLKDSETLYSYFIDKKKAKIISQKHEQTLISISKLKKLKPLNAYLYEFLSPYNFNASVVEDIIKLLDDISGKQFLSPTHRLVKDRTFLIITKSDVKKIISEIQIFKDTIKIDEPIKLSFKISAFNKDSPCSELRTPDSIATLDYDKLQFPLLLRKWKQGDYFYPFGMNKIKKLSRFFIDNKLSIADKENIWVLCSANKIVWIVGHRIDNRFRVSTNTKNILTTRFTNY